MENEGWISWRRWRELSFDLLHGLEVEVDDEDSFRLSVAHETRGTVSIAKVENTPHSGVRSLESIKKRPSDYVGVVMLEAGHAVFELENSETTIRPGDIYLHDLARPMRSTGVAGDMVKWRVCHLPRSALAAQLDFANEAEALKLDGRKPETRVFRAYLNGVFDDFDALEDTSLTTFETAAIDMLNNVLMMRNPGELTKYARDLMRAQNALLQHLDDPNLSVQKIAEHVGIGPRTIHRLFQNAGTTPGKWLEEKRLEAIAKELKLPINQGRSISSISQAFGYSEFSHFSRNFKKRYGVSPREYRKT